MALSRKVTAVFGAALTVAATGASAAVPVAASDAIASIGTDSLAMIDLAWPVIGGITVGFVLLKIFKKLGNRVS